MKRQLNTTKEQFDALHAAADKVRSTSETVKVDKHALINLLMDHGGMATWLRDAGINVE